MAPASPVLSPGDERSGEETPSAFVRRLTRFRQIPIVKFCLTRARRLRERLWFRTLIAASLAIFFLFEMKALVSSFEWVVHADLAIADGIRLEKDVLDCETAVRGYLLSHERSFLTPYETAVASVPRTLLNLRQELRHSPEQEGRLTKIAELISVWLESSQSLLATANEAKPAKSAVAAGAQRSMAPRPETAKLDEEADTMDQLRQQMSGFLLDAENERANKMLSMKVRARRVLITGTALTFILRVALLNTARWLAGKFRRKKKKKAAPAVQA